jgi:hypothetical protein
MNPAARTGVCTRQALREIPLGVVRNDGALSGYRWGSLEMESAT